MAPEKQIYFGIDLGTTNSVISWGINPVGDDSFNPQVVPIQMMIAPNRMEKKELLPSCVYFGDEPGNETVGEYAKTLIRTRANLVAKSIKSDMGMAKEHAFHNTSYTPAGISAFILKVLADGAKTELDIRPEEAVITVPASFNSDQRAATLEAAQLAGFLTTDDTLLDEPHAALYAYTNRANPGDPAIDFSVPKLVLVFDLGGGTLDVSIHNVSYGQGQQLDIKNIAIGRYSQIGGDNFDKLLGDHFLDIYTPSLPSGIDETGMTLLKRTFQEYAEEAKTQLGTQFEARKQLLRGDDPDSSTITTTVLQVPFEDRVFSYNLTLREYEEIIDPLLAHDLSLSSVDQIERLEFDDDDIIYPILDALDKANLEPGTTVDAVLLNGGMTKLSVIRKRLQTFFGPDTQIIEAGDPDKAVALGATLYHHDVASNIGRYQNKPRILNDTIGLEIAGGTVIPLVEAGTILPSLPKVYDKLEAKAGANHIELPFYSGRRTDTKSPNRKLLAKKVTFGKPLSKDEPVIIQMQVDEKGILNVEGWLQIEPDLKFTATVGSTRQEEIVPAVGEKEEKQPPSIPHRGPYTLNVKNELSELRKLLGRYTRQYDVYHQRSIMAQITNQKMKIVGANNAEDFIAPLIKSIGSYRERFGKHRMIILLGMLAAKPKKNNGESLHDILEVAMDMSKPEDVNVREAVYVNSVMAEAIVTIGKTELSRAEDHLLHFLKEDMPISVRQSAIYAIGKCCEGINVVEHLQPLIQSPDDSVRIAVNWALGKIGRRERENPLPIAKLDSVISGLSMTLWGEPHKQAQQNNIYALGEICDRRSGNATQCVTDQTATQVLELLGTFQSSSEMGTSLKDLGRITSTSPLQQRANLAIRMIKGEQLSIAEERSLLKIRIREDD